MEDADGDMCTECQMDPAVFVCATQTPSAQCDARVCGSCVERCSACRGDACPLCVRDCPTCDEALVCAACVSDLVFVHENYVAPECARCAAERELM